ncbi:MAG: septal ring lytic transglycosylase RlpA family protein [Gammaproteobacteria bacterium]|nr:septal ring lytic transglycosylase RlpA family protein [Gammaproteobacteria bacterium]MBU1777437.1 septal ring lytic transglycosylase RlpA family protein [Gammaproteobacteria bacterium]MBU1968068.1 septal ring lytic transglycosylase RlpA family protein [Gammaproteobacteria bacterium]
MNKEALLACIVALAVTGCATSPGKDQQQGAAPIVDAASGPNGKSARAASTPSTVSAPASSGGGYLPGDGPGGETVDLNAIPDAVPKAEPLHRYANRPYSALGKTYTPLTETGKYKERGSASWYGKKFHGQRTSIGETYDMYGMTAAHPTLPIPSYARVTNVATGKSVVVRVNDRGPFLHERIMDLSYVAAAKLGYINTGSAEVEVESIRVDGNAPVTAPIGTATLTVAPIAASTMPVETAGTATGQVFLQLGAFRSPEGAESFLSRMRSELGEGSKPLRLYEKDGLTRVHLGPYASASEARSAASRLEGQLGFKPFVSKH